MKHPTFGLVLAGLALVGASVTASAQSYNNAAPITINDSAPATPYPSNISVSGVTNTSNKVTVTLNGFSHTYSGDLTIVVVSPTGQSVALIGNAGGSNGYNGGSYTFDDAAATTVTGSGGIILPGTYRASGGGSDVDAPAPSSPYGSSLGALGNLVNGTWSLYVDDQSGGDIGQIAGGWTVNFAPNATCASEGYTSTKLDWCKNICERGLTGATLDIWIHRWITRYRDLPYCAVAGSPPPPPPPPPPPQEG